MRRTIIFFLLLLLLLPAMAQKPFTARVVAGKDFPYYITSVKADIDIEEQNLNRDIHNCYFEKLDNRTYTLGYSPKSNTVILLDLTVINQQGEKKVLHNFLSLPIIQGEQLVVTLHDAWDVEIGGSQLYREYGNALRSVMQQGDPLMDYIAKHRKERGCALFVLSEIGLSDTSRVFNENRRELFDPAALRFFGDPKDPDFMSGLTLWHDNYDKVKMNYFYDYYDGKVTGAFDRQLEGQAIIDAIGRQYKGKPTLVTVWTYSAINNTPNAYELYLHAKGMNLVHLTSISENSAESYWKSEVARYPGDHNLLMRYQVDSLFQHYMPGVEYPAKNGRHFYILLDAEGKVVAHGDRNHNYRQLITLTDQLKAKSGLLPFKEKPYEMTYLDWPKQQKELKNSDPYEQAMTRMSYHRYLPIEGHGTFHYPAQMPYNATAKQLNISQRLYNAVRQDIEVLNKSRHDSYLQAAIDNEAQKARQKESYVPDTEKYRKVAAAHIGSAVDLGLSVMWADVNVGASKPEEAGYFFTWGDVEPVSTARGWSNYRWSNGSENTLRKYNTQSNRGPVDMRTTLLPEDDAATVYWQNDWRMPTKDEVDELFKKCKWEWTELNGVAGCKVTGPNGNHIFLPHMGCYNSSGYDMKGVKGYYWTSSIDPENPQNSYYLCTHADNDYADYNSQARTAGRSVRPVYQPNRDKVEAYRKNMSVGRPVDLGLSVKWADMNVGASTPEEAGCFFTWGDVEPLYGSAAHGWNNYHWSNGSENALRKYNTQSNRGPVDQRTTLLPEDDAATVYWQGDWRMPTKEEVDELLEKCKWEWTEQNGVKGAIITGPNGNHIFLPTTGCYNHLGFDMKGVKGYFWTSSIDPENPQNSYYLCFRQGAIANDLAGRMAGRTVRPVFKSR